MNKEKQSNRSLIISIISIVACVVLLIGATMAWFTDTETNTGNRIEAGTLDAKLYKYTGTDGLQTKSLETNWEEITNTTASDFIFDFDPEEGWAVGETKTIYLAVQNAGSLAFAYDLDLVVEDKALADALQVSITSAPSDIPTDSATYQTISSLADADVDSLYPIQDSELAKEAIDYIQIDIKLDASTGDSYQDLVFAMDLVLTATQEGQSDTVVKAYDIDDITGLTDEVDADKTVILMNDITDAEAEVEIPTNVNIDLNGYTLTVKSLSMETTDICTVDIVGGEIKATGTLGDGEYSTYGVLIHIPNGTINMHDTIIATNNGVTIDASEHTLNLIGSTAFLTLNENNEVTATKATVTIMNDTRVVVDTDSSVSLKADSYATVIIEDNVTGEETILTDVATEVSKSTLVTDYDELVATIDAANEGDVIVLSAGEFVFTSTITIDKGITLKGAGESTILTPSTADMEALNITSSAGDVTLDGLYFTGFGSGKTAGIVVRVGGTAVADQYAGDFVMTNCKIDDYAKEAIWVCGNFDTTTALIDSCYIDTYSTVSGRAPNAISLRFIPDAVVTNNTVINSVSTASSWSSTAIYLSGGTQAIVKGNTIKNCGETAIWADSLYDYYYAVSSIQSADFYQKLESISSDFLNASTIVEDNSFLTANGEEQENSILYSVKRVDGGLYVFSNAASGGYIFDGPNGYSYRAKNQSSITDSYADYKVAFTTLEDALASAKSGETIYILQDTIVTIACTIPEGVTVEVASGVELTIGTGSIMALTNQGTIINNGIITIYTSASLKNNSKTSDTSTGEIINNGTITNSNVLYNYTNATLTNNGTITNNNTLTNYGTLINESTITNNKTLNNYGTLTNNGILTNTMSLTNGYSNSSWGTGYILTNNGTINNSGTLTNYETLNNTNTITNTENGSVINNGTWTGKAVESE